MDAEEVTQVIAPTFLAQLSEIIGTSEPALRLLISIFLGYPVALLHRNFLYGKNANIQHLFCLFSGLVIGYFNYGCEILHPFAATIFTYLTLVIFGGSAIAVAIVFIFNMAYLLLGYYYVGTDNYDINWTMPQCILVLRMIGLSYDVYDGSQPLDSLSEENKKVALIKRPTFLEICGHAFFPTSFSVGPQFPMKRYQDFIAGKFSDSDSKVPPDSVKAAEKRFLLGIMYLLIFQIIGVFVSDEFILSDYFDNLAFFKKCFLLGLWGRFTLYKYISCWLLTEGACILFGITYNGEEEDGTKKWNGLENVKISILENATEFNHFILSFNTNTNHWVAQYVYKRLKFLGNRYISQAAALLFLAVWHGFHSGYFVCFAFEFIVMYLEKDLKPMLVKNETLMKIASIKPVNIMIYIILRVYTFVFMGWCLLPFALLTYDRYWKVYSSVHYMGIIFFCLYPVLYGPILRLLLKPKKQTHQE